MGWLRELHDKKKFVAVKVATEKNLADDPTKPLDSKTRKRLDEALPVPQPTSEISKSWAYLGIHVQWYEVCLNSLDS